MHPALKTLRSLDLAAAAVHVWAFKKSQRDKTPIFTGRWIATKAILDEALRGAVIEASKQISETKEYGLLAQNNESSAMTLGMDETYAPFIVEQVAEPTLTRKVKNLKEIANATFYVVRLLVGEQAIYAVRKTDDSWRTRKAEGIISVIFEDAELALDSRPRFSLSRDFDFFIVGDTILVQSKGRFESVLNFKEAHVEDFGKLRDEPDFSTLFSTIEPLSEYVGTNKIQLRRASAIRQKGNYKNPDFMKRLRNEYKSLGFRFDFDAQGRIIPTRDTCGDIFKALLDHRLESRLSQRLYDVEDTEAVTLTAPTRA